jgi:hypothetical protein
MMRLSQLSLCPSQWCVENFTLPIIHTRCVDHRHLSPTRTHPQQNIWSQLLVCRRSNLMALIPLTGQRMDQLSAQAASLATVLQGQVAPLQPQLDMLAVFESAHRSTAEELRQAGAAASLVSGWVRGVLS